MTYELTAVIGAGAPLAAITASLRRARLTTLPHGLALIPVTEMFLSELGRSDKPETPDFQYLTAGLEHALIGWSAVTPVAYVEAEFFGGVGEQTAAVWERGQRVFGPLFLAEDESPPAGTPISQALRVLGVDKGPHADEFDAADLGRHRHTRDWFHPRS
jgi:hypothetical protein